MKKLIQKLLPYIFPLLIALSFFIYGVVTLHDYGNNWDSPFNYRKGNAVLHYLVSGQRDYKDLPSCPHHQGSSFIATQTLRADCATKNGLIRSVYQDDAYPLDEIYRLIKQHGGTHPAGATVLAALSNTVFYRVLGIMDDITSYHLFTVFCVFLLSSIIGVWATKIKGSIAGVVAVLVLSLYPLLFAEKQFNFKDPVIATFFTATLYVVWLGMVKNKLSYFIGASVLLGLSLATKFNIVFLPFILLPWFAFYSFKYGLPSVIKKYWFLLMIVYTVIPIAIFLLFNPYMWHDPIKNALETVGYYKNIGSGIQYQDETFFFLGFNTYPLLYFFYTTPPFILFLTLLGSLYYLFHWKKTDPTILLWFLLLLVPFLRVTLPGFSSYGGVRQILEFTAGMALISGYIVAIGYEYLMKYTKAPLIPYGYYVVVVALFFFSAVPIFALHPNENVYFNTFIGGVLGAKAKNFPGWSDTFGNIYYQGIDWLNKHAQRNAQLSFSIVGGEEQVPLTKIRPDIKIGRTLWSGVEKRGEYIIETNIFGSLATKYGVRFQRETLLPVHTLAVDGVPFGYIYKNDNAHTKKEFQGDILPVLIEQVEKENFDIIITLNKPYKISKLSATYQSPCETKPNGWIFLEDGTSWQKLPEPLGEQYYTLPTFEMGGEDDTIHYYFVFPKTQKIKISLFEDDQNSCPSTLDNFVIQGLIEKND